MDRHILVPLDGSPVAEQALPHAIALAATDGATLHLLQVVTPPNNPLVAINAHHWMTEATAEARRYLDRIAAQLVFVDIQARTTVLTGEPAAEILRFAGAEPGVEAIAMASHGYGAIAHVLFGSVAQKVLAATPAPLLLVRMRPPRATAAAPIPARLPLQAPRYKTILVPLDGSAEADAALGYAERIARITQATLVLAAVTDRHPGAAAPAKGTTVQPSAARQRITTHLETIATRLERDGLRVRTHIAAGDPVTILGAAAILEHAALIVMATHARIGLKRLWLGNIALGLSAATALPILMVRTETEREYGDSSP